MYIIHIYISNICDSVEYDYVYIYILSIYIYRNFYQSIFLLIYRFIYIYVHNLILIQFISIHFYRKFVQFIGKVCPNNCLEVFKIIQMKNGNNFDMGLYDKVVELSNNKFSHLFL
jgi:hypothetical protein